MLNLTDSAQTDLEQIADYTLANWGKKQTDCYLGLIEEAFYGLLDNPYLGKSREDIKAGYCSLLVEKHLIFYRVSAEGIEIMRVLHCQMDVVQHL
jgi:toxin ParE1/3/4